MTANRANAIPYSKTKNVMFLARSAAEVEVG
jgi:hypothetical protein